MEKNDLIIRRQAIDAMCDNCATVEAVCPHYPCHRYMAVESLPSVQPEIIRCKDCANWDTEWKSSSKDGDHYCPMIDMETNESFYCAEASERKDNG